MFVLKMRNIAALVCRVYATSGQDARVTSVEKRRVLARQRRPLDAAPIVAYNNYCQMQLLPRATLAEIVLPQKVAQDLLDALPPTMRFVRKHMRSHRKNLSVPAFRALCLLGTAPEVNVSAVSDFLGASLSTTSRIVSTLVQNGLVMRHERAGDRRQIFLTITPRGRAARDKARNEARSQMAALLDGLDSADLAALGRAAAVLQSIFTPQLMRGE